MSGSDQCDPIMLDLFRAEMDTHLPALSQGLLTVEKGQAGEKDFEAMMRAAHSIKGAARIVGLDTAVRVAHAMEDCFSAAQGMRLTLSSDCVDVLLQGVDTLQKICSPQADLPVTPESIVSLLEQIAAVREGKSPSGGRPAPLVGEFAVEPPQEVYPGVVERATRAAEPPHPGVTLPVVFDDNAAESLRKEFIAILRENPSHLPVNFAPVQQVSAAALSLLASVAREVTHREPEPAVTASGVSDAMAILLRTTGLDRVFHAE